MSGTYKAFFIIMFTVLFFVSFPIVNSLFTMAGGLKDAVDNATVSSPYLTFERLFWGNFHFIIAGVALIGIAIWAFRDRG